MVASKIVIFGVLVAAFVVGVSSTEGVYSINDYVKYRAGEGNAEADTFVSRAELEYKPGMPLEDKNKPGEHSCHCQCYVLDVSESKDPFNCFCQCPKHMKPWKGVKGEKGPRGVTGDRGLVGRPGRTGIKGVKGSFGPRGIKGKKGPQGPRGPQGVQGYMGKDVLGPKGLKGFKGDSLPAVRGPVGPTGRRGDPGKRGVTGRRVKGWKGPVGPRGHNGPTGFTGPKGYRGPRGSRGAVGPTGYQGPMAGAWDGSHLMMHTIAEGFCAGTYPGGGWNFAVYKPTHTHHTQYTCMQMCNSLREGQAGRLNRCSYSFRLYPDNTAHGKPASGPGQRGLVSKLWKNCNENGGHGPNFCCCHN